MKKFLLFLALILLMGFTTAFNSNIESVDNTASIDDPAEFNLQIENTQSSQETFSIHIHDYHRSQWYSYNDRVRLDAGETETTSITVNPDDEAIGQRYGFDISVRPSSSEISSQRLSTNYRVIRQNDLNIVNVDKSETYDPGETVTLDVTFQNVDSSTTDFKEISLQALDQNKSVELGPIVPGGNREIDASFEVDEYESPGRKEFEIGFDGRNYIDGFNVTKVDDISEQRSVENRIFVVNQETTISNNGNTVENHSHTVEKPSYLAPVVYASGAQQEETENGVKYTWDLELEPGQTETVETRTDYWIPLTGLMLLLGGFLALKKLTSNVSTSKTVTRTSEGLDVKIEIENNSSKVFDDVLLEDFIPNIAELDSNFEMAKPEVTHTDKGTKLKWWLTELEPGDQRILKYSIRPKVEVEGGITLKQAVLKDGETVLGKTDEIDTEFKPSE